MELKLETLRRAVEQSTDNVPLLFHYARSFEEALAFGDARDIYEKILEREPDNLRARFGLARVMFFDGRTSESAVRVEAILREAPDFAEALLFMGRIHVSENNHAQAAECVQRAKAADPEIEDPALEEEIAGHVKQEEEEEEPPFFIWKNAADDWPSESLWSGGEADSPFEFGDEEVEDADESDVADYEDGGFFDALETGLVNVGLSLTSFEQPDQSFRDLGGLRELKEAMRMLLLYPIKNEVLFSAYGRGVGGSVLLYGPPGCGKTLAARATAGEVDARFMSVQGHQILDRTKGFSERALHQIFEMARSQSSPASPAVLFFDDVDALAVSRECRGGQGFGVVNQFLFELDRMERESANLLVICATSAPWLLDAAFRRRGRFDQTIFVGLPDRNERADIIRIHSRRKPLVEMKAAKVAARTKGFTGSELKAMFDLAANEALVETLKTQAVVPLRTRNLLAAAKKIRPAAAGWFETLRSYLDDPSIRPGSDLLAHLRKPPSR